jgi:drug/metabolite transporter (DMT)-like permease
MIFVGAAWGANLPVSKVLLTHFDTMPLVTMRTALAGVLLALMVLMLEGIRSLRIDIGSRRFFMLGFIMGSFFFVYVFGIKYSNPIGAAVVQVAGPLVAAVTVFLMTGQRFDPGFGTALLLTMAGGAILVFGSFASAGPVTLGGGEAIVLGSQAIWTAYSIKAQVWFRHDASQLHRTYVASLSAMAWMSVVSIGLVAVGWASSPLAVSDGWVWSQFLIVALFSSALGGYFWNVGASRLGVAIASLWGNLVPFFAVLWSMAYGFMPNAYQIVGGLVALTGVVYMQWRKLSVAPR